MNIVKIKNIRKFKEFSKRIYKDDPLYRDNKSALIDLVCKKNSAFYKNSWQEMVAVCDGGNTICQCALTNHKHDKDTMMLSFFESLPNAEDAVSCLVDYAGQKAKERGCIKLVVGVDGHCNYSVGFLIDSQGTPAGFGEAYNPIYYNDYFRDMGWDTIELVSVKEYIPDVKRKPFEAAARILKDRIRIEYADLSRAGFENTIKMYTDISNEIFEGHRYCAFREFAEDLALLKQMKPLLNPDNLIFAFEGDEPVGFLLWYPDFNEFLPPGKGAGIGTFINYRIQKKLPTSLKVTQIGILPKYRNRALILHLFGALADAQGARYSEMQYVKSSWILSENNRSKDMSEKILRSPYKKFATYEKDLV